MSAGRDPGLDALLREARADFARRLPAKADELGELLAAADWRDLGRAAHTLRGSAAVYGFAAVGAAAGELEDLLRACDGGPDAEARARIDAVLRELRAGVDAAAQEAT
jgi:HPt (histidine-containing phosphotransfer) domain-containing protein